VKFATAHQDVRLTDEENEVIRRSASLMNEAYTRKQQSGSPAAPDVLPDSQPVPPVSQPVTHSPGFGYAALLCAGIAGLIFRMARENR
jgi:hypothetical protein